MSPGQRSPLALALQKSLERSDRFLKFYDFDGPGLALSYLDFGRQVMALADGLTQMGVGPGRVVAVLGPTSLELCRTCAAVWSAGAALTVLPTPTKLGGLESYLEETLGKLARSQASLLLGDPFSVEAFSSMLEFPALGWQDTTLSEFETGVSRPQASLPDSVALVQFSSGTTRDPEPIMLSAGALLANSQAVLGALPGSPEDHHCASWLPLYHDMGLIGCFLMPLLASSSLTLMAPEVFAARPVTWLEAISSERATISSAPNFALAHCADRISDEQMAGLTLQSWTVAMVGAEAVRPHTLQRFARRFASVGFSERAFSPVYGLAEATLAVTFSPLGQGLKTLALDSQVLASSGRVVEGDCDSPSLGSPLENVQVAIRRGSEDLPENTLGEVYVAGPSLFGGYVGQLEKPDILTSDGWLRTGDMGFLNEGELYLYGRRRDILLLDGRNHDPSLLEGGVEVLPDLRRCCAFTSEESKQADRDTLVLLCEVSGSFGGAAEPLRREILARARAASGLTPSVLVLLKSGTLPSTSSGKLRRREAARQYISGALELWESAPVGAL